MEIEEQFFRDVIELMPSDSICYIQAPDLPAAKIQTILSDAESVFKSFQLNQENKSILNDAIVNESVAGYLHSIEIKSGHKMLFEGFDCMEIGTISKNISLPQDFIDLYVNQEQICFIAKDW